MIDTHIGYEVLPATLTHSPKSRPEAPLEYEKSRRGRTPSREEGADEKLEENGESVGRIDRMHAGGSGGDPEGGGEMKRKDKSVDRTDRLERGILFRRNENNNARIGILPGRRLGP